VSVLRRYLELRSPRLGPFGVRVLFWVLLELWILNAADLALTSYSLWLGFASESNAIMDFFFRSGPVPAALFKIGIVTAGTLLLWRLRAYRTALVAAVMLTGVFAALVAYEVLWISSL
jgi:hypothetical protein